MLGPRARRANAKLIAKRAFGAVWPRTASSSRRIVLLYHAVGGSPLAVDEVDFRAQMEWLASAASVRPLVHVLENAGPERLQVALTFDDGYASVYSRAFPILRRLGMTGAVFVNTGHICDDARQPADEGEGHYPGEAFLLWRELAELSAAGWTVGSHGVRHLDLTREPDERVRIELTASRADIAQKLGSPASMFAYTWGRHTPHLRQLVKQAGYSHALGGIHAPVTGDMDAFAIPRIAIARDYTLSDFKAVVQGDWDYLAWLQRWRMQRSSGEPAAALESR